MTASQTTRGGLTEHPRMMITADAIPNPPSNDRSGWPPSMRSPSIHEGRRWLKATGRIGAVAFSVNQLPRTPSAGTPAVGVAVAWHGWQSLSPGKHCFLASRFPRSGVLGVLHDVHMAGAAGLRGPGGRTNKLVGRTGGENMLKMLIIGSPAPLDNMPLMRDGCVGAGGGGE
jgi:hypothetical protein